MELLQDPVVGDVAKKHKRSPAQVTFLNMSIVHHLLLSFWVLMLHLIILQILLQYHVQQEIAVIPKSMKPHHILENTKVNF